MIDTKHTPRATRRLRGLWMTLAGALALYGVGAFDAPLDVLRGGSGEALQASVGVALMDAAASDTADAAADAPSYALLPTPALPPTPDPLRAALPELPALPPEPPVPAAPVVEKVLPAGQASFYGRRFAGRATASGERFDPKGLTAAHRTLPFGTRVRVTNERNGRSVVVRINDRGPYAKRRVIDVSRGAAEALGMVRSGTARVKLEVLAEEG